MAQREISASMLSTLFRCPLAFYFQYIKHEKVPDSPALAFGKSIHYMLKSFYDKNFKSPDKFVNFWGHYWYVQKIYEYEVDENGKPLKDENGKVIFKKDENGKLILKKNIRWFNPEKEPHIYKNIGSGILTKFYNRNYDIDKKKQKSRPLYYEKRFRKIKFKGHLLGGRWDRVDKDNKDNMYITDYKTNRRSPQEDIFFLDRLPQFIIYSASFRELFGKKEKNTLFYHLRSGNILKIPITKDHYGYLEKLLDSAQKRIEEVESGNYIPYYSFFCNFCVYKEGPCKENIIGLEGKLKKINLKEIGDFSEEFYSGREEI